MTVNVTLCLKPDGMCYIYETNTAALALAYQFSKTESGLEFICRN